MMELVTVALAISVVVVVVVVGVDGAEDEAQFA
jgi:hypothetical protein